MFMKDKFKKVITFILMFTMIIGSIPQYAFAIDGALLEGRSTNAVKFASGMHFYEAWSNGKGYTDYHPVFDVASGRVMFCVDPGVGVHSNLDTYGVTIANGTNLTDLIKKAQGNSKLNNVSGKIDTGVWNDVLSIDELETMDTTKLDSIIAMMSVLHTYAGTNRFGSQDCGTLYNTYAVMAVQNYIWDTIDPKKGQWSKMDSPAPNTEQTKQKVKAVYKEIKEEAARLYLAPLTSFSVKYTVTDGETLGTIAKSKTTSNAASISPIRINKVESANFIVMSDSLEEFKNISYININNEGTQNFAIGDTASINGFSITHTENGFSIDKGNMAQNQTFTVEFSTSRKSPTNEDWAIYAQGANKAQSFFTAYKAPNSDGTMFMSFEKPDTDIPEGKEPNPSFPSFEFFQHKYDSVDGFDGVTNNTTTPTNNSASCTPVGDTRLDATFTLDYTTDKGASGSVSSQADLYGHGASETISPWGTDTTPAKNVVTEKETWDEYPVGEDDVIDYISAYDWDGSCTVTIIESEEPEGHHPSNESYTHTIKYHAETHRSSPYEDFAPIQYTITIDGQDTGLTTTEQVMATWNAPLASPTGEDDFINEHWDGVLQIIKKKDSDDIFSEENGQGTTAGGVVGGKEYSTNSKWTIRIVDKSIYTSMNTDDAAELFNGYEESPYIKVVEDNAIQNTSIGDLMHCYKVMLDGSGIPANEENPLTPSKFGQIYISGIPYGTYLVTEYKADGDRYVKESMYFTISEDNQIISTDIQNTAKENVVRIVKVDSETGKTVPSANTAFRIKYMGSPEYDDPTQTPNYGRYLPNASNLNASVTHPEDYIFYTDTAGEVTIPYALPYGSYQIEELLVPEGYYIGKYKENGIAGTTDGKADVYGPNDDNHQTTGSSSMEFIDRVAIYNADGQKVNYTTDENIVFNFYNFDVTEQDDHLDGKDYKIYNLTIEMHNTAAKGKVQISKLGERLVGFKTAVDEYGNTVSEPIYESFPLEGVKFGIYAAEDVLLEDGEEAPIAYDKITNEEIDLVTDILNHIQFPDAEIVQSGIHENTKAEVVYTKQRDKSENNISTVEYLTPVQKGTRYSVAFNRYDKENKLTYDYDVEFGLEYTAGGWNYTDIKVTRTITADDYVSSISDELPQIYNGEHQVTYNSAIFSNKNKMELNSELTNDYNEELNHYETQVYGTDLTVYIPEIEDATNFDYIIDMPEIPNGYSLETISDNRITVFNNNDVNDILVAVNVSVLNETTGKTENSVEWKNIADAVVSDYFKPHYTEDAVKNMPELTNATFLYATSGYIYVQPKNSSEVKVVYTDSKNRIHYKNEDGSDITYTEPHNIPDGYTYVPNYGMIIAYKDIEGTNETLYKMYVLDTDTNRYRWIDCTEDGCSYKQRVQEFDLTLTQHNTSEDGWIFKMDGLILKNFATNEDTATATITLPYNVNPVISDSVGCEISEEQISPIGKETTIIVHHPTAPVYFDMIDNTNVEMVFLGGYTKTTLTVPAENELPKIFNNGKEIDYFDNANGGLTPDKNKYEYVVDDENYIRVERFESNTEHSEVYYVIDVVNNATDKDQAFVIDYHGSYESRSYVTPDALTGANRGILEFSSIYRTMRYPLSDLVETISTDANGMAVSSLLPLGNYIVRELEVPDGFVASNAAYPITLDYKNQFTPLIWASTEVENGAVNVQLDITKGFQEKLNSSTYNPKAGAVFGIYAYEPIVATYTPSEIDLVDTNKVTEGQLIATVTVNEDGKAVETLKLPMGDYYVQEISTIDGYEVNSDRFIFRVDDSQKSDMVEFSYESNGIYGKIMHTGYKAAEIEVTTYTQIPILNMTINDIVYDLTEELETNTVGNNVLVKNSVDNDRSTFNIIGSTEKPIIIKFDNGSKLIVTIKDSTYTAQFINGETPAVVDSGKTGNITVTANSDGSKTYEYNPLVAFTGYTAQTSTIYTAPQTRLTANNGTTLEFAYDLVEGVKKAIIGYPKNYEYYANNELPTNTQRYNLGDIDMNGSITLEDITVLNDYLDNGLGLTSNQLLLADANEDNIVNTQDISYIQSIIDGTQSNKEINLDIPYLPTNAIKFETEGLGNNAYVGTVVDKENRTITVDLSRLTEVKTVTIGNAVVTLDRNEITLDAQRVSAKNTITNKSVNNGYQPDALTLVDGKTLISSNRNITLQAARSAASVGIDINYDHSFIDVSILNGIVNSAWVNGELQENEITAPLHLGSGNTATFVFADNSVYHIELSNTGYISMSVENILNGNMSYDSEDNPILLVNGSAENFVDVHYEVIKQTIPMDETSIDDIRQYNTKNVTLARNDGFVKQLQVKINSTGNLVTDKIDNTVTDDGTNNAGTIENDLRPWISKIDATNGKELPNAKISISDANGNVIAQGYSDKNGKFYFDKPEPGTYTFKEVSAPAGYKLNKEVFEFIVHPDGTITGDNTIKDYPNETPSDGGGGSTPKVYISKVDVTTSEGIPNAKIEILSYDKETVIASGYTDKNGKFYFKKPANGQYWFREVVAPDGYVLNEELFTFTIEKGVFKGDNTITNGKASISKIDATNAKGVAGATIEILDMNDNIIISGITDENGKFYFDRPQAGVYKFHEIVAPNGYILNEEMFTFEVTEQGSIIGDMTITNEREKVTISKIDVTTSKGIAGATIEVLDLEQNVIASGITDENGEFKFDRPEPGTYKFHETVAPNGYILSEDLFDFTVQEDYSIIGTCTIGNVPNTVTITKVETITSRPVEGAEISLYDKNGNFIQKSVSDKDGKVTFTVPKLGTYQFKETKAPEGYLLDNTIHSFVVHSDGSISGETQLSNAPYIPKTGLIDISNLLYQLAGVAIGSLLGIIFGHIYYKRRDD